MKTKTPAEQFIKNLVKHGFSIERNTNKLRYLDEALENHQEEEVFTRIINDTFQGFRNWAQRKNITRIVNRLETTDELQSLFSAAIRKLIESEKISQSLRAEDEKPDYIKHLIDKCLLYPDGKRVVRSLDDVASALRDYLNKDYDEKSDKLGASKEIKFTWQFLQEMFLKSDGSRYEEKSCRDAVRMSNYQLVTSNTP